MYKNLTQCYYGSRFVKSWTVNVKYQILSTLKNTHNSTEENLSKAASGEKLSTAAVKINWK